MREAHLWLCTCGKCVSHTQSICMDITKQYRVSYAGIETLEKPECAWKREQSGRFSTYIHEQLQTLRRTHTLTHTHTHSLNTPQIVAITLLTHNSLHYVTTFLCFCVRRCYCCSDFVPQICYWPNFFFINYTYTAIVHRIAAMHAYNNCVLSIRIFGTQTHHKPHTNPPIVEFRYGALYTHKLLSLFRLSSLSFTVCYLFRFALLNLEQNQCIHLNRLFRH